MPSVGLLIPCSLILVAAFCRLSPAQDVLEYISTNMPNSALIVPAWQTHMPTKQGNVPRLNPQEEQIDPKAQAKIKQDPAQLQRKPREPMDLSLSLQPDFQSVNRGLH